MTEATEGFERRKRVCVIGAGLSGLPSVKELVARDCFDVVCYEARDDVGGLWYYDPNAPENQATVMESTVINASKEMMTYSDFPADNTDPSYMHHTKLLSYIRRYTDHYNLRKYIQFNTGVRLLRRADDFDETGQWITELTTGSNERFDHVMVCTGHHAKPYRPHINGLPSFRGHIMHSQAYRNNKGFEGKNVLVIGIGNSGLDIASEVGRVANKTLLSTRRGAWVGRRNMPWGMPSDAFFITRFFEHLRQLHNNVNLRIDTALEFLTEIVNFDHDLYGLRPEHGYFAQHVTVNDNISSQLMTGQVQVRGGIDHFTENRVVFRNGVEDEIDTVILCTGYDIDFPFLERGVMSVSEKNDVDLFMYVWHPNLSHCTSLAFIGYVQPIGPICAISELQARWATQIFAGDRVLPPHSEMLSHITKYKEAVMKRYTNSRRHTVQVDFIPYMDDLARHVGCYPPMVSTFFKDFSLWNRMYLGPNVPAFYRLHGPGNQAVQARDSILSFRKRIQAPFEKSERHDVASPRKTLREVIFVISTGIVMYWLYVWYRFTTPPRSVRRQAVSNGVNGVQNGHATENGSAKTHAD